MQSERQIAVHLLPAWAAPAELAGGIAVVIDVLRATTTMLHALAAGCAEIRPVAEVAEARKLADQLGYLVVGERHGRKIDGFDLGNSPAEFTPTACAGRGVVWTTTNGVRAILHACSAQRTLLGAFVNFSAVCEELRPGAAPIHLICAGTSGSPALEDALCAGAIVDFFAERGPVALNDAARLAWDAHEQHGRVLISALELSCGGRLLLDLGMDDDLKAAACVDRFCFVPEVYRDPFRIAVGTLQLPERHFRGASGVLGAEDDR